MRYVAIGLMLMPSCAAWPNDAIPNFDAVHYCEVLTKLIKGDDRLTKACIDSERATRERIERVWPRVPQSVKDLCLGITSADTAANYQTLASCMSSSIGDMWLRGDATLSPR